ncbi:MAG: flagellar biosynthesis protein FlhB [Desulfobacteraceae bacterium 4572_19]|nr:MAG: flagellar biosynthesis protein FlhB [Desulfobacteraceae bacterium 4572_19]
MAEDSGGGEKTEDATGRKLDKAREEGQVGKSQEVPAVFVLLAGVAILHVLASFIYQNMLDVMRDCFSFQSIPHVSAEYFIHLFYRYIEAFFKVLMPVLAVVFFAALVTNFFQVGFVISWKALEPKFSKLNPIKGFAQKFSSTAFVEFLKSIIKLLIVAIVTYYAVVNELNTILNLYDNSIGFILAYVMKISYLIFMRVLMIMAFLAVLDFAFQKEVKDEHKQTEGDPQIKSDADVVVTNPTHLAVAIKYDSLQMDAPKIVAKGAGMVAENIKKIANENQVPIVENKELARNLYKHVETGEYVPLDLYQAVAELLAYVYNMKGKSM